MGNCHTGECVQYLHESKEPNTQDKYIVILDSYPSSNDVYCTHTMQYSNNASYTTMLVECHPILWDMELESSPMANTIHVYN